MKSLLLIPQSLVNETHACWAPLALGRLHTFPPPTSFLVDAPGICFLAQQQPTPNFAKVCHQPKHTEQPDLETASRQTFTLGSKGRHMLRCLITNQKNTERSDLETASRQTCTLGSKRGHMLRCLTLAQVCRGPSESGYQEAMCVWSHRVRTGTLGHEIIFCRISFFPEPFQV